jgi:serine/threonine protein kinase
MILLFNIIQRLWRCLLCNGIINQETGSDWRIKSVEKCHQVALKKMQNSTDKQKARNLSEIAFLKNCKHPNIVEYFSALKIKNEIWVCEL